MEEVREWVGILRFRASWLAQETGERFEDLVDRLTEGYVATGQVGARVAEEAKRIAKAEGPMIAIPKSAEHE